ncbi:MAG TPA: Type 1 glutamine amidotransferase-like domain-containing protein [Candidatus Saccharimonadales bacterium]|nr:Type 1 glutamine amidotransferase-like domain-containing protein [Candidatus Saccharimonadales bacterium]
MKLLLTSGGIANNTIAEELVRLVGKPAEETKVAFIPTGAFVEAGEKSWFVGQFVDLANFGFVQVDIIEPSLPHTEWRQRLADSDVIYVSGGNTYYLLDQSRQNGFAEWLQNDMGDRVYVGSSAGSLLVTPTILTAANGDQNTIGIKDLDGVGLVDFELLPHVPDFISLSAAEAYAQNATRDFYALDDQSALSVQDGEVRTVGEGNIHAFPRR